MGETTSSVKKMPYPWRHRPSRRHGWYRCYVVAALSSGSQFARDAMDTGAAYNGPFRDGFAGLL